MCCFKKLRNLWGELHWRENGAGLVLFVYFLKMLKLDSKTQHPGSFNCFQKFMIDVAAGGGFVLWHKFVKFVKFLKCKICKIFRFTLNIFHQKYCRGLIYFRDSGHVLNPNLPI